MTEKVKTQPPGLMSVYDDPELMRADALLSVAADIFYKHGFEFLSIVAEGHHCYHSQYWGDWKFMAQATLDEYERFRQSCEDPTHENT